MTYLILPSYGYQLICSIVTLTTLALGCLMFLPIQRGFGERIIIGFQLVLTALGLVGALASACGFFGTGPDVEGFILYLGVFGVLAVCVRFFFIIFLPCFFLGSPGAFIGCIIGALIGGVFVCPLLWLNALFLVYSSLYASCRNQCNGALTRISSLVLLLVSTIPGLNLFFHNQSLNFSSTIINQLFFKKFITRQEVDNQYVQSISRVTLTGDLGSKSITAATTFGNTGLLAAISSGARRCSALQFVITPQESANAQTVSWHIHSCNTGDTTAQTYVNGALLTEEPLPLRSYDRIEVRRGKRTPVSLVVSIRTMPAPRNHSDSRKTFSY